MPPNILQTMTSLSDPIRRAILWTKVQMFFKKYFSSSMARATESTLPEPELMSMPHICPTCKFYAKTGVDLTSGGKPVNVSDGSECIFGLDEGADKVVTCHEFVVDPECAQENRLN